MLNKQNTKNNIILQSKAVNSQNQNGDILLISDDSLSIIFLCLSSEKEIANLLLTCKYFYNFFSNTSQGRYVIKLFLQHRYEIKLTNKLQQFSYNVYQSIQGFFNIIYQQTIKRINDSKIKEGKGEGENIISAYYQNLDENEINVLMKKAALIAEFKKNIKQVIKSLCSKAPQDLFYKKIIKTHDKNYLKSKKYESENVVICNNAITKKEITFNDMIISTRKIAILQNAIKLKKENIKKYNPQAELYIFLAHRAVEYFTLQDYNSALQDALTVLEELPSYLRNINYTRFSGNQWRLPYKRYTEIYMMVLNCTSDILLHKNLESNLLKKLHAVIDNLKSLSIANNINQNRFYKNLLTFFLDKTYNSVFDVYKKSKLYQTGVDYLSKQGHALCTLNAISLLLMIKKPSQAKALLSLLLIQDKNNAYQGQTNYKTGIIYEVEFEQMSTEKKHPIRMTNLHLACHHFFTAFSINKHSNYLKRAYDLCKRHELTDSFIDKCIVQFNTARIMSDQKAIHFMLTFLKQNMLLQKFLLNADNKLLNFLFDKIKDNGDLFKITIEVYDALFQKKHNSKNIRDIYNLYKFLQQKEHKIDSKKMLFYVNKLLQNKFFTLSSKKLSVTYNFFKRQDLTKLKHAVFNPRYSNRGKIDIHLQHLLGLKLIVLIKLQEYDQAIQLLCHTGNKFHEGYTQVINGAMKSKHTFPPNLIEKLFLTFKDKLMHEMQKPIKNFGAGAQTNNTKQTFTENTIILPTFEKIFKYVFSTLEKSNLIKMQDFLKRNSFEFNKSEKLVISKKTEEAKKSGKFLH